LRYLVQRLCLEAYGQKPLPMVGGRCSGGPFDSGETGEDKESSELALAAPTLR
jgi:hypothetical protein